jgi:hypothetical protein
MSKPQPPALATIDLDALSSASGGRRAASSNSSSSSRYGADDRILDALKDVTMALKELSTKSTQTNGNDNSAMLTTLMTTLMSQQQSGCNRRR